MDVRRGGHDRHRRVDPVVVRRLNSLLGTHLPYRGNPDRNEADGWAVSPLPAL